MQNKTGLFFPVRISYVMLPSKGKASPTESVTATSGVLTAKITIVKNVALLIIDSLTKLPSLSWMSWRNRICFCRFSL